MIAKEYKLIGQVFSQFELTVVVVIVALLAIITFPSFDETLQQQKRTDAQTYLLQLAQAQDDYLYQHASYASSLAILNMTELSPKGHYRGHLAAMPKGCSAATEKCLTFKLTATPNFSDELCLELTYNSAEKKGSSGTGSAYDCWR